MKDDETGSKKRKEKAEYPINAKNASNMDLRAFSGVYAGPGMSGNGVKMGLVYAAPMPKNQEMENVIPLTKEKKKFCENCGAMRINSAKFCSECGFPFERETD